MLNRVAKAFLGMAVIAALGATQAFAQDAPKKKAVKDQAEYDLYNSVSKETDPTRRLVLINTWKDKYPDSDYKNDRVLIELQSYSQMETATLGAKPTPESLAAGQKAANTIVANLDTYFAPAVKPDTVSDADWQKARSATEVQAHTTLGWIAMQSKDNPTAEAEYKKVLAMNDANAQVSYWLGTVIALQKVIARTPEALYSFARASSLTGPGALTDAGRASTDAYLKRAYVGYHGDETGLDDLKAAAAKSALPPQGFVLKSVVEIEKEKAGSEEEYNKQHPDMAMWKNLKAALTGDEGPSYFEKNMKGALVPQEFKGKVVSVTPAVSPKQIVLAIENPGGDATLNFETPLRGKVEPGTELSFKGSPSAFAKDPYMVTFEVERADLKGWPGAAAPAPVHKRPVARRRR